MILPPAMVPPFLTRAGGASRILLQISQDSLRSSQSCYALKTSQAPSFVLIVVVFCPALA